MEVSPLTSLVASLWEAEWPAPARVATAITTRLGGASGGFYAYNNLGLHVGDKPEHVTCNRRQLAQITGVSHWQWLQQVHGTQIVPAQRNGAPLVADGSYTRSEGLACVVLTADCLPVLLCNQEGTQVAAVHAGWRGLAAGVVAHAVATFDDPPDQLLAYLAPAISQRHFEVDQPVLTAFEPMKQELRQQEVDSDDNQRWQSLFEPVTHKPGHYRVDLYGLARWQLQGMGVHNIWGGHTCTFADEHNFYSYRRDGVTGRFASAVWLKADG